MKVLGLSCGRPMSNSEILLREALTGAQEKGAETEIIRLLNLTVKHCIGCLKCQRPGGECVQKNDHIPFLMDKIANSDGVIISAPAYSFTPPGFLLMIRDRLTFRQMDKLNKPSRAAQIIVGGSNWVNLGLPLTEWCFFPHGHVKFVDQMIVPFTADLSQVVLNEYALGRARNLGRNMGEAVKLPIDQVQYIGSGMKISDEEIKFFSESMEMPANEIKYEVNVADVCPVCHSNLIHIHGNTVSCAMCDIKGKLSIEGDKLKVIFDDIEQQRFRSSPWEQKRHMHYVQHSRKIITENEKQINKKVAEYRECMEVTTPPKLK